MNEGESGVWRWRQAVRWMTSGFGPTCLAVVMCIGWVVLLATLSISKHQSHHSGAYDLAICDQAIWNTTQGRFLQTSVTADSPALLGHHFSPLLLVLVPLYWWRPDPTTLLATQAILLGSAGLLLYWLARTMLRHNGLALAVLAAYLLHPATSYVALSDFHQVALAVPLLSLSFHLLLTRRDLFFVIPLAFLLLVKEEMGLIIAMLGVFTLVWQRRRLLGGMLVAAGMTWTWVMVVWVIPAFHPQSTYIYGALYEDPDVSMLASIFGLLTNPVETAWIVLAQHKIVYVLQLLVPLFGIPLLGAPALLMALPVLIAVLLTDRLPRELIQLHYSATILPALLAATIMGIGWMKARTTMNWSRIASIIGVVLLASSLLGAYYIGPLPGAVSYVPGDYQMEHRIRIARRIMARIPAEASVIAQSNLVPQMSHRPTIQVFGYSDPSLQPDYYFLDTHPDARRYP